MAKKNFRKYWRGLVEGDRIICSDIHLSKKTFVGIIAVSLKCIIVLKSSFEERIDRAN